MNKESFLDVGLEAVKRAEAILLESSHDNDLARRRKSDGSWVTPADEAAQQVIVDTIKTAFPSHQILGEEGKDEPTEARSDYCWVIDPIDGTNNFLRGNPLFATELALMHKDTFVLGISNSPVLAELVYAERGHGAMCNGQPIHVSSIETMQNAAISFGGIKHFDRIHALEGLVQLNRDTSAARGFGDAWSFHLLAQGKIDIMVEAKVKLWDVAAAVVIVQEAGGVVTELDGQPFGRHSTTIAATNGRLHDQVLSYFR